MAVAKDSTAILDPGLSLLWGILEQELVGPKPWVFGNVGNGWGFPWDLGVNGWGLKHRFLDVSFGSEEILFFWVADDWYWWWWWLWCLNHQPPTTTTIPQAMPMTPGSPVRSCRRLQHRNRGAAWRCSNAQGADVGRGGVDGVPGVAQWLGMMKVQGGGYRECIKVEGETTPLTGVITLDWSYN